MAYLHFFSGKGMGGVCPFPLIYILLTRLGMQF